MQNSTYNPNSEAEFTKKYLQVSNKGVAGTAAANGPTNIDYALPDDMLLVGAQVLAQGSAFGDTCDFQVVAPDGTTVVNQFFTDWGMGSDEQEKLNILSTFPAKIPATYILRVVYHNTNALTAVKVLINYKLDKILV